MIESKFTRYAVLAAIIAILLITSAGFIVVDGQPIQPLIFVIFFTCMISYFVIWLIFGELRTKAVKVAIGDGIIEKRGYLGIGLKRIYNLDELSGYKTSRVPSKVATYEFFYLMVGGKKVIKLSQFYHENYNELKRKLLSANIRNLGNEQWKLTREIKEIFE